MKNTKSSARFKSFKDLRTLLEGKALPTKRLPRRYQIPARKKEVGSDPDTESRLFQEAMDGVVPIRHNKYTDIAPPSNQPKESQGQEADSDTLNRLHNLVNNGEGFVVSDTPEYREGVGYNVHPRITKHLHGGQFSIQAHIDLHGLTAGQAQEALEFFFKEAITTGKRAVLIVHGRGLSSPQKPVLKNKVHEWLTSGPWRKWVIAFTSARAVDGGAGATYVLLRRRPITKRFRKKVVKHKHD
jgi:DNA-nicking Smr family endonuclease